METSNTTSKQKTLKDIKCLSIQGKRWFQKSYGNTYCAVKISIRFNDESLAMIISNIHYGYGDYYQQLALDEFKKFFPETDNKNHSYLTSLLTHEGIMHFNNVHDVPRERDLKNWN